MRETRRNALLGALAAAFVAITALPQTASAQSVVARSGVSGHEWTALAGPANRTAADDPPPFTCWFGWEASWPAGNPVPLTYAATVECGPDFGVLDPAITIQASLYSVKNGFPYHTAAQVNDFGEARSEATFNSVYRPDRLTVRHRSTVYLMPDNPTDPPDIWYYLPAGCTGVGTPVANCDFHSDPFTV